MKKILFIGGSSSIGRELVDKFPDHKVYSCNSQGFNISAIDSSHEWAWSDIDIVVNLAAKMQANTLDSVSPWTENTIAVNCLGAVNVLSHFLPYMKERGYGRIIMMSSVLSSVNVVGQGVYSASKAFVDKLVTIAALENAKYGITVNSIQLGYVGIGSVPQSDIDIERALNKSAMKRFCSIDEIVNTINYIINTEYFTGAHIRLDGGIK